MRQLHGAGVQYVTEAALIVAGVREDSYREILGARVTDFEHEMFWSRLFEGLKERGLTGVQRSISNGHMGINCYRTADLALLSALFQRISER